MISAAGARNGGPALQISATLWGCPTITGQSKPAAEQEVLAVIFDTQITLRLFSYPIVNGQTTEKLERETTVWAARKSVNRAEYYQAAQAGKRTDAIFRMHSAEYGGEQQLVCGSDVFDVVRSYGQETEEIELTCKRRDGA